MRIISGQAKGRILKSPAVKNIRPTLDKVKEALFDILGEKIAGVHFLELFAGSGSIGIEALSRRAKTVVFVDRNGRCIKTIKENLKLFYLQCPPGDELKDNRVTLLSLDALKAISFLHKQKRKFDIIFLDPPYNQDWVKKSLINLSDYDILKRGGMVIAEHCKRDILPADIEKLKLIRQRRYSNTFLSFYKRS